MRDDPRQLRTRTALRAALRRLLADHALDEISVSALCRAAAVHRTTFYAHAPNVPAFAIAEFSDDIERIATVPVRVDDQSASHVAHRYLESLIAILEHITEDRLVYRALLAADSRGAFRAALGAGLEPRAESALEVFAAQGVPALPSGPGARTEAAAFIAGAMVGVIGVWAMSEDHDARAAGARISGLMPVWWPPHDDAVDVSSRSVEG